MASPAQQMAKEKQKRALVPARENRKWICRIREEREKLGLSQRDVAKSVGLSNTILVPIENGCDLRLTTALALAEFFGKDIWELWEKVK